MISATILQYFFLFRIIQKDCRHVNYFLWADKSTSIFWFWLLNFLNKSRVQIELTDKKKREWKKSNKDGTKKTEMSEFQDLTSKERFKEKRMRDWEDGGWLLRSEVFTDLISTPCLSLYMHSHSFISSKS